MIDTIVLRIPKGQYHISKPENFRPNAEWFSKYVQPFSKCVNNPTAQDRSLKRYRPCLTLIKRMTRNGQLEQPLSIQFSAPKLLYDNNLQELTDTDFENVLQRLADVLKEIGIHIFRHHLASAQVTAIHYSKNIELTDGYTSNLAIKELGKVNVPKRLDITKHRFQNDGQSLQYYASSNSIVFYDKIQDIKKTKNKATDKDQNYIQRSLFEPAQEQKLEILRIETRLANRRKLNSLFQALGFNKDPTFREIFNKTIAQTVIKHYWNELIANHNLFIFDTNTKPKQILKGILINQPDIKPKQAIYLTGLKLLAQDGTGIRELRQMLERKSHYRTWLRIGSDLKKLNNSPTQYHDWVKQIITQIEQFEPYKPTFEM